MATHVSQDEINALAWRACDTFRGAVDPSEYKNYIPVEGQARGVSEEIRWGQATR